MSESTDFLYPFLGATESDSAALLQDLAESARAKAVISAELRRASVEEWANMIEHAGAAMAERVSRGGRIYTFGNGGSSTDADTLAALFARPATGRPIAARCLANDQAVLTALGNDIGFDSVFSRQLMAYGREPDIAIALSASGNSDDLMVGLGEAKKRGLLTLGFAGYEGGQMAVSDTVDFCFTIRSQSIHRIQESQALVGYRLWAVVQEKLAGATESSPAPVKGVQ